MRPPTHKLCKLCARASTLHAGSAPVRWTSSSSASSAAARKSPAQRASISTETSSGSRSEGSSDAGRVPGLSAILSNLNFPKSSSLPSGSSASAAASTSSPSSSSPSLGSTPIFDPLKLVGSEISLLRNNVQQLLGSGHPALDTIAKYYFQAEGKHIRPLIVLLISQATNGLAPGFQQRYLQETSGKRSGDDYRSINDPLESRPNDILNDVNPHENELASAFLSSSPSTTPSSLHTNVLPSQRRLAEITEMIHVASLLHDDVIDTAATRRSQASAPAAFGNKLSILGGDFLLARASLYLSRLGSNEVVELVASVLANLVEGEVMQIKGNTPETSPLAGKLTPEIFEHYLKKTYLKTASLIAKSSRATVVLGGAGEKQGWVEGERIKDIAYSYGRNLGIAFQLVDDLLDFTGSDAGLGKPSQGADLKLGLATAPALYAWDEFPEMGEMILRKFEGEGDVERARDLVRRSSGPAQTAALAEAHAQLARDALKGLPESEAREALEGLTRTVLSRTR